MEITAFKQFGESPLTRVEEIKKKLAQPDSYYPIDILGDMKDLPVITVGINFPSYRLKNGRTKTAQLEYIAINPDKPENLFDDQESYDAQSAQHEILGKLVNEEGLLQSFKKESQTIPILCTNTGVVVNGNRRLCAWRTLFYSDSIAYRKFERIRIAILPELNDNEICSLEKQLQIKKDLKASYHWHAEALMAEDEILSGKSEAEVAVSYDLSAPKLHTLIEAKRYAQQYLETIVHPNEWSLVDKSQYAFESIADGIKKIHDYGQKELFIQLSFDLIQKGEEIEDRLYATIKNYANEMPTVTSSLTSTLPEPYRTDHGVLMDSGVSQLAGGATLQSNDAVTVSEAIDHGYKVPHSQIKAAIEAKKALNNEKAKSKYLLEQLSKIASILQNVINTGITEQTKLEGVQEQLNNIKDKIATISGWLERK